MLKKSSFNKSHHSLMLLHVCGFIYLADLFYFETLFRSENKTITIFILAAIWPIFEIFNHLFGKNKGREIENEEMINDEDFSL